MIVHCLFEQSGTFKNEFKKLGYEAYDYDIQNAFGETDYVVDLFSEIERAYDGAESIFDRISEDDLIVAFFPCIRFENQIMLAFRGQSHGMEEWDYRRKMENDMRLMEELKTMYDLVNKLFIICMDKCLRLVMENPYSEEHFLRRYWCLLESDMSAQYAWIHFCNKEAIDRMIDLLQRMKELWEREERSEDLLTQK